MTNKSEPAFPCAAYGPAGDETYQPGLTKREYFAAMAMKAMIIDPQLDGSLSRFDIAKMACAWADALIEELNK